MSRALHALVIYALALGYGIPILARRITRRPSRSQNPPPRRHADT